MREAEVTVLCTFLELPDIKRRGPKGDKFYLDEQVALASQDLERARRYGGVSIRWIERCQVVVPNEPRNPVVRSVTPLRSVLPQPAQEKVAQDKPIAEVAREIIREVTRQELSGLHAEVLETVRQALSNLPVTAAQLLDQDSREILVGKVSPMPMFVPTIQPLSGADVSVSTEESEGSQVDAASKALRQRKKD